MLIRIEYACGMWFATMPDRQDVFVAVLTLSDVDHALFALKIQP
jgi:hypothetical protein